MRPLTLIFVGSLLMAFTGCEELTNQRRIGEDAQTQQQQDQLRAEANKHQRDLAFQAEQALAARQLKEKQIAADREKYIREIAARQEEAEKKRRWQIILDKAQKFHEQVLRDKRYAFLAPVLKFLSVVLGLALIVILGIKMYFIHKLQLADVETKREEMRTKAESFLELCKLANAEYWKNYPQLSQAQQEATLERLLPPALEAA